MKKQIIGLCMVVGLLALGGCYKDDLAKLQSQVDELGEQVIANEAAIKDALAEQLATLMSQITDLQTANAALGTANDTQDAAYEALLTELTALQTEIDNNSSAVFYGNLISDDEYASFLAQGASIVTGKVVANSQENIDGLALLETVGQSLEVTGAMGMVSIPMLKTVAGDVSIYGLTSENATVDMPALTIIGGALNITENAGLVGFSADATNFIYEGLYVNSNNLLASLTLAGLNDVGEINIANLVSGSLPVISELDLSATNVSGNVSIGGVKGGDVTLGQLNGDLILSKNVIGILNVASTSISGDLIIEYTYDDFTEVHFDNMINIDGNVSIINNSGYVDGESVETGVTTWPGYFDVLERIGGNVTIKNNNYLSDVFSDFNAVTEVGTNSDIVSQFGTGSIDISINADEISLFNALIDLTVSDMTYQSQNIDVDVKSTDVSMFSALTSPYANKMSITLSVGTNVSAGNVTFVGFDAVTMIKILDINLSEIGDHYNQIDGGTGNILAFGAVTEVKNIFTLDVSAENGEINFTGLNALATVGSYYDFTIRSKMGGTGLAGNINAFASLTSANQMVVDYQVRLTDPQAAITLSWTNPLPAPAKKMTFIANNMWSTTEAPASLCSGGVYDLFTAVYVDGTIVPTSFTKLCYRNTTANYTLNPDNTPNSYGFTYDMLMTYLQDCPL